MKIPSIRCDAPPRVERLREAVFRSCPKVCPERAELVTASYRETEDQPILLRRAMAFDRVLRGVTIPVLEDELIVGHLGRERRSCPVFPEMAVAWLEEELDTLGTREQDRFELKPDARERLLAVFPYWRGRTVSDKIYAALPEETAFARFHSGAFSVSAHEETAFGHVILSHEKVLRRGLRSMIDELREKLAGLDLTQPESLDRERFYRSAILSLEAAVAWAHRYADEARRQAETQTDPARRSELEGIAQVCERVPEFPARTFHEALQCIWFIHLLAYLETDGSAVTVGRLDRFAYPYLKADLERGEDPAKLQELLDCFWLKFAEMVKLYKLETAKVLAGFPMGQNIVIGGTDPRGREVFNELSVMCLEAHRHCRLYEPNFSVRIHQATPERFLRLICENITMGTGHPVVFNEDVAIESLLSYGIPLKEARDYAPIGCVENSVVNMWMRANGGYLSLAKLLELAVHDGVNQLTGERVGPKTGLLEDFETFEDFLGAYRAQMAYFVRQIVVENNLIDEVQAQELPTPYLSALFDACVERGTCVTRGGNRYNFTCPGAVGVANAADGLAAVKKLVFEEKRLDPKRLRLALAKDFAGEEELLLTLRRDAPKYGNDEPYVDELAGTVIDLLVGELDRYRNYRGGKFAAGLTAITANLSFGALAGATPDGRRAREALAEGVSPAAGRDVNGPTAGMCSVVRVDHARLMKGLIYNQKFSAPVLSTEEGRRKLAQLLRGYCAMRGGQVQFNVVSRETLLDAQRHPDRYRDLVVRVAGYSAFYTELSREVQDQIILRTQFDAI